MSINADKTKEAIVYYGLKPHNLQPITINDQSVSRVTDFKLLGIHFNNKLTWHHHIEDICEKASNRLFSLVLLRRAGKSPQDLLDVYCSTIRSVLEYAAELWHPNLLIEHKNCLEHIQERALKIIYPTKDYESAMSTSKLETLHERREIMCKKLFTKISKDSSHKLYHLMKKSEPTQTRSKTEFVFPKCRTERCKKSPINYMLYNYQKIY